MGIICLCLLFHTSHECGLGPVVHVICSDVCSLSPLFLPPCSLSPLYNAALNKTDYYDDTSEISPNSGLPYGFFHHPMEGLPDGYPVLVSAAISLRRAVQTLQYIEYGGLMNREATDTLTLKMVLYNPAAIVFGYYSAVLKWLASGEISMTVTMQVKRTG